MFSVFYIKPIAIFYFEADQPLHYIRRSGDRAQTQSRRGFDSYLQDHCEFRFHIHVAALPHLLNLMNEIITMGTKIRVDQVTDDDLDDWNEQFTEEEEISRSRVRYNGKRRRQIEDLMEERRLMRQIGDIYDDYDNHLH